MRDKKSQVSLFVTLSVLTFLVYLLLFNSERIPELQRTHEISSAFLPVSNYVETCLGDSLKEGVFHLEREGLRKPGNPIINLNGESISYYLYEGINMLPSITELEVGLADFATTHFAFCVSDFKELQDQGFEISLGSYEISTTISEQSTAATLEMSLTAKKGDVKEKLRKSYAEITFPDLKKIHSAMNDIITELQTQLDGICISCLIAIGERYDLHIEMLKEGDSIVFTIHDYSDLASPYTFEFAVKLRSVSCSNLSGTEDPVIVQECLKKEITKEDE